MWFCHCPTACNPYYGPASFKMIKCKHLQVGLIILTHDLQILLTIDFTHYHRPQTNNRMHQLIERATSHCSYRVCEGPCYQLSLAHDQFSRNLSRPMYCPSISSNEFGWLPILVIKLSWSHLKVSASFRGLVILSAQSASQFLSYTTVISAGDLIRSSKCLAGYKISEYDTIKVLSEIFCLAQIRL